MKKLFTILLEIVLIILLLPFAVIYGLFRFFESFYDIYLMINETTWSIGEDK